MWVASDEFISRYLPKLPPTPAQTHQGVILVEELTTYRPSRTDGLAHHQDTLGAFHMYIPPDFWVKVSGV